MTKIERQVLEKVENALHQNYLRCLAMARALRNIYDDYARGCVAAYEDVANQILSTISEVDILRDGES